METNQLIKTVRDGYHAGILLIGTTRFFLLADFTFIYDLVIAPIFSRKHRITPPPEIIALVGLLVVTSLWSPEIVSGIQTAIRVYVLAAILPTYKYGWKFKQVTLFSVGALALLSVAQSAGMSRSIGLHSNPSLLGQTGLVFFPMLWAEIGIAASVIVVMSLARLPMVVLIIFSVLSMRRYFLIAAATTAAMFLVYASISTPDRITFDGVKSSTDTRLSTVTGFDNTELDNTYSEKICGEFRPAEFQWHGYGFNGFCQNTGQPRPHNIYILSMYDFGIFAIPFWILVIYAARKLHWLQILPLLSLGMFTDELIGRPEGIYLIAIWIIATNYLHTANTPSMAQTVRKLLGKEI